jgi:(2Fe-2S) ferredoxin
MSQKKDQLKAIAKHKGIGSYQRHILICPGPKCIGEEEGLEVWKYLKQRLKEEGLEQDNYRSKVGCLRVCTKGPIALVYPEGVWYKLVDQKAVDRIIDSHLKNGVVVEDLAFAENPL